MNAVIVLLALSAVTGFALGSFSWFAIGISGLVLAVLSSAALHIQGFSAFPGIAIVVACLTVNQIAYLVGVVAHHPSNRPTRKKADARPSWFL
jgi:hypothetical protein